MEASNLPDTEFKILMIRMFNELRGRINELSESLHKDIKTIQKSQ